MTYAIFLVVALVLVVIGFSVVAVWSLCAMAAKCDDQEGTR